MALNSKFELKILAYKIILINFLCVNFPNFFQFLPFVRKLIVSILNNYLNFKNRHFQTQNSKTTQNFLQNFLAFFHQESQKVTRKPGTEAKPLFFYKTIECM